MPGIVLDINNAQWTRQTWSLHSVEFTQVLDTDKINREL